MQINNNSIGPGNRTYIIAEMSGNHCGKIEYALAIIRAAKEVGADAVKLQTYTPDTITLNCKKEDFVIPSDNPWADSSTLYELYEKAYTPWEWHEQLFNEAKKIGIDIFSSPFDHTAVDFLEKLNAPAYKIASPEITDIPLIKKVAATKKPVIISTGVAEREDIDLAMQTLKDGGATDVVLLKCTSSYPAPPESINLKTMVDFGKTFDCLFGLSDHTMGIGIPVAAVALGASVIEKHFIIKKDNSSVDSFFSLDYNEFKQMVDEVRSVEKAIGKITYGLNEEGQKAKWGRRSLYFSKNIKAGETVTDEHIKSVRPSYGLHPKFYDEVIGKKAKVDLEIGDRLSWEVIE
jgi:pseudaminic acid synthase